MSTPVPLAMTSDRTPPLPATPCRPLILAGPPGAGKTTHGTALAQALTLPEISMGNLLRDEVRSGTALGVQIAAVLAHGDLVAIDVVEQVLEKRLRAPDAALGFVLDGVPRRLDDAHLLERLCDKMGLPPVPMLLLAVPDAEIVGRVANRRVCDNQHIVDLVAHPPAQAGRCDVDGLPLRRRADDEPSVVAHRLAVYHQETEPVIAWYASRGLLRRIDGVGAVDAVSRRVIEAARELWPHA